MSDKISKYFRQQLSLFVSNIDIFCIALTFVSSHWRMKPAHNVVQYQKNTFDFYKKRISVSLISLLERCTFLSITICRSHMSSSFHFISFYVVLLNKRHTLRRKKCIESPDNEGKTTYGFCFVVCFFSVGFSSLNEPDN